MKNTTCFKMLLVVLIMGIMGCGAQSFAIKQAPSKPFNSFGQIEVKEFRVDITNFNDLSQEEQSEVKRFTAGLASRLQASLAEKGFFASKTGEKLIIEGRMIEFNPGSRTARYLIGFGVGSSKIVVEVTFTSQDGTIIAKGIAEGGVSAGTFGGDISDALNRLVDAITDFVEKNYR